MKSLRHLLVLLVALSLVAAACGDDDDESPSTTDTGETEAPSGNEESGADDPQSGGTITVAMAAEAGGWLPSSPTSFGTSTTIAFALYDTLLVKDADGALKPFLAESIEPNEDLTEWTVKLRPGVTFHDGTALTAEVLKANFEEYLAVDGSSVASQLRDVVSVEAPDDLTFVYKLGSGNAAFPDLLTGPAGMPFSIEAARADGEDATAHPVGTGPFRFVSWQRDNQLIVEKNPDYWRDGLPYLDGITFRVIPDDQTRLASLDAGDVDVMQTIFPTTIARVLEQVDDGELDAVVERGAALRVTYFNTTNPPLDDKRVRRALALAADQGQIIEAFGGEELAPQATQFYGPDSPWFSEAVADAYPTEPDLDEARRLIDDYISDPQRSDGRAAGEPVGINRYVCRQEQSLIDAALVIAEGWSKIGINVEVEQVEQAALVGMGIGGTLDQPFCFQSGGGSNDPYFVFSNAFGSPDVSPQNITRFTDPRIDEQLEVLRTTTDLDERKAAVEEIGMVLVEEMPLMWNAGSSTAMAMQTNVKNADGWTLPDGSPGNGYGANRMMLSEVWLAP